MPSTQAPTEFRRALGRLPLRDRLLLHVVVRCRVSYGAVAAVLGVTRGEVARRVLFARKRLSQLMK